MNIHDLFEQLKPQHDALIRGMPLESPPQATHQKGLADVMCASVRWTGIIAVLGLLVKVAPFLFLALGGGLFLRGCQSAPPQALDPMLPQNPISQHSPRRELRVPQATAYESIPPAHGRIDRRQTPEDAPVLEAEQETLMPAETWEEDERDWEGGPANHFGHERHETHFFSSPMWPQVPPHDPSFLRNLLRDPQAPVQPPSMNSAIFENFAGRRFVGTSQHTTEASLRVVLQFHEINDRGKHLTATLSTSSGGRRSKPYTGTIEEQPPSIVLTPVRNPRRNPMDFSLPFSRWYEGDEMITLRWDAASKMLTGETASRADTFEFVVDLSLSKPHTGQLSLADAVGTKRWRIMDRNGKPVSGPHQIWELTAQSERQGRFVWWKGEATHVRGSYTMNAHAGYLAMRIGTKTRHLLCKASPEQEDVLEVCVAKPGSSRPRAVDRSEGDLFRLELVK